MRGVVIAVVALVVAGAFALPGSRAPSVVTASSPAAVLAYPVPGTDTITTRTQISFRGAPKDKLGKIVVTGSRSGRHAGTLRAHSDGRGASFLPKRRFAPGERVSVRTSLKIRGARRGDFSYQVARRPPLRPARRGESPKVGDGAVQRFVTRPGLMPPAVTVTTRNPGRAPGHVFLAPKRGHGQDGPMIIDDAGRLVWFKPMHGLEATDFRVQTYRGKPVLTWWQGRLSGGEGRGQGVIYDDRYRLVARVRAANGYRADLHEFLLTPRDTAYVVIYDAIKRDLSSVGGSRDGVVSEAVVQEIDIATGLVLFEWHSLGNIALRETYTPVPEHSGQWDYMHVNSVAEAANGDLILSSRATRAAYRVSKATGRIKWRLGGKRSDFRMKRGSRFAMQHDVRPHPDGTFTLYDNSATPPVRKHSRAITLVLDTRRHTATLKQALTHPLGLLSATQGNAQRLPTGGMFVGFGSQRWFSEFDADGRLVYDGSLAPGNDNYRAYRFPWHGRPAARPKVVATRNGAAVSAKVSWNGATDVANWQLLGGASRDALAPVATVPTTGFETTLNATTAQPYVAVRALDAGGAVLATSAAVKPRSG